MHENILVAKGRQLATHEKMCSTYKGTNLLWNDRGGSCYCSYNGCQNYFNTSCALNRPFEHIICSITFNAIIPPGPIADSMLSFTFEIHLTTKRIGHPPSEKLFSTFSARGHILKPQISTKMGIGCRTANTIGQFSCDLESRQLCTSV